SVLDTEPPLLIAYASTSFNLYMTYEIARLSDRQILDVLVAVRRRGGMAMIHAENADCIAWLTERLEAAGRLAPRFHGWSRPALVEREGAHRAIAMAELVDVPVLLVHISGDRKSTRLNSSHVKISYAVFGLDK